MEPTKGAQARRNRVYLPDLIDLVELMDGLDPALVGGKAATLGRLAAAGFPVPAGFVVTEAALAQPAELQARLAEAGRRLGSGPFAVRSSGAAEDLADASYAGLYETFLNVHTDELPRAVADCFASAATDRVSTYQSRRHQQAGDPVMAVLVQRMVHAEVAGVAFTAHPVTGNRDEVLVTAVRGLGEQLVSGATTGEEWTVHAGQAVRTRPAEPATSDAASRSRPVLQPKQAQTVAAIATDVATLLGAPQDIEWAIDDDGVRLLQARPMTALPDPVTWQAPGLGLWMRNFRLGEWLPEAMTPLFADWLLPAIESGYLDGLRATVGTTVPFRYASVNGWYFNAPPIPTPRLLARAVLQSRGRVIKVLFNALVRVGRNPVAADRAVLADLYRTWRDEQLPAYRRLVADGEQAVDDATPEELAGWVDRIGHAAGQYLWSLAIVGGSAWKIEACLAQFCRTHLPHVLDHWDGPQVLVRGLPDTQPTPVPDHAVHSLDWYRPTAGETRPATPESQAKSHSEAQPESQSDDEHRFAVQRHQQLATQRSEAEGACRAALAETPQQRARFDQLLEVAQRYASIREEQARDLTLGWPLLRRCVLRLGRHLRDVGVIADTGDVFFLHRSELESAPTALTPSLPAAAVADRRTTWQQQCRLAPPLTLGTAPRLIGDLIGKTVESARGQQEIPAGAIVGHPASSGRASGRVRIVNRPEEFAAFQVGEILVAKTTTPAWTPLFARAAAVVTDGGSLAAHASLVAREYGIPAVVGTGNATHQLRTGQPVTVDGTHGTITSVTAEAAGAVVAPR